MALNFNFNTPAISDSGTALSGAYARIIGRIFPSEDGISVSVYMYESEAAYNAGRKPIEVDEIPRGLYNITFTLTGLEYLSVDMASVHDDLIDIYKDGSTAPKYPSSGPEGWPGLTDIDGLNNVTKVMPA